MKKHVIIISFALFAMFFGAGNLIFPPSLGAMGGSSWIVSLLGFLVTGVGMPILGVISMSISGGDFYKLTKDLPSWFSTACIIVIILIIGPLFAIPRTAATTYEIGVLPFIQDGVSESSFFISGIIARLVFFILTLLFVLAPNSVIDKIGKFLTPFLIAVLFLLIGKGIATPMGSADDRVSNNFFLDGFREGYQTMDALASLLFATIIISAIKNKGYTEKNGLFKISVFVGLGACLGLALSYGGLAYLGASSNFILDDSISRSTRLVEIADILWGDLGKIILSIAISLACLTTSTGLVATTGDYFSKKFNLSYKMVSIFTVVISFFISIIGVDGIIIFAGPVLEIVYPVTIALIFINFILHKLPNSWFTRGAIIGTLSISIPLGIIAFESVMKNVFASNIDLSKLTKAINSLPFASVGLSWLVPAIIGSIFFGGISMLLEKRKIL